MNNNISIFIPLRSGSQRIQGKNHKKFAPNGDSLFEFKLNQISKIWKDVLEIVVSTDDQIILDKIRKYTDYLPNLRVIKRKKELSLSNTKVSALIQHAEEITLGSSILWLHVTSPFVDHKDLTPAARAKKLAGMK